MAQQAGACCAFEHRRTKSSLQIPAFDIVFYSVNLLYLPLAQTLRLTLAPVDGSTWES